MLVELYCYLLLALHGLAIIATFAREDSTDFATALIVFVAFIPLIGRVLTWW